MHRNVNSHARNRETQRSLGKGGRRCWPLTQLPILHYISHHHFLIDTGTEVSVLPTSPAECRQQRTDFSLVAVNGATIPTYEKHSLTLNLGLRRTFRWVFIIASVHIPIIGANFLRHFSLLLDMPNS